MTLVPERIWNPEAAEAFRQEASIPKPTQLVGCYLCRLNGDIDPPETIFMVKGTSVCSEHLTVVV